MKLRTEAPVNGGRNYNGPKVNDSLALVKSGYMLEGLSIPRYAEATSRDNVTGADNQQERPAEEDLLLESSETVRQIPTQKLNWK